MPPISKLSKLDINRAYSISIRSLFMYVYDTLTQAKYRALGDVWVKLNDGDEFIVLDYTKETINPDREQAYVHILCLNREVKGWIRLTQSLTKPSYTFRKLKCLNSKNLANTGSLVGLE